MTVGPLYLLSLGYAQRAQRKLLLFALGVLYLGVIGGNAQNSTNIEWPEELSSQVELPSYDRLLVDAMYKKLSGNLGQAAILLTDCLKINPLSAAAYYELSDIYLMANDKKNMLVNARLAVKYSAENNVWFHLQLAKAYHLNELLDSAIYVYQIMLDQRPADYDIWINLSLMYSESRNYRKALATLGKTEKKFGNSDEITISRYQIDFEQKKYKKAEKELKKAQEANPSDPKYYGLLAELKTIMGDEASATAYYNKLMEIDPENDIGFLSMIEFYKNSGRETKALEETEKMFYSKSIDIDIKIDQFLNLSEDSLFFEKNILSFNKLGAILFELAPDDYRVRIINVDRNIRENNLPAASDDLIYTISKNKINFYLWEQLFYILNTISDFERLFKVSDEAISIFPERYLPYFFKGVSGIRLGRYREASDALGNGVNRASKGKDILINFLVLQGEAYHQLKEYSKSDSAFEQALQIDDSSPVVLNNYSYYLSLRGSHLDKAEEYINKCLQLESDSPTYLDTKGWILYKEKRYPEAQSILEKALSLDGGVNEEILSHYIQILSSLGDTKNAINQVIRLLNIKKETISPEEKLKEISKKWGQ